MDDQYCQKLLKDAILIVAAISLNFIKDHYGINQPRQIDPEQYLTEWHEKYSFLQGTSEERPEYPESRWENVDPRFRRLHEVLNRSQHNSNIMNAGHSTRETKPAIDESEAFPDTTACGLVFFIDQL